MKNRVEGRGTRGKEGRKSVVGGLRTERSGRGKSEEIRGKKGRNGEKEDVGGKGD